MDGWSAEEGQLPFYMVLTRPFLYRKGAFFINNGYPIIIDRPDTVQYLCADRGYSDEPAQQAIKDRNYISYLKQHGEEIQEKKDNPQFRCRRWVAEVTHS